MKALLTGSYGFIGRNLENHLINLKAEIKTINEDIFEDENWWDKLQSILEEFKPSVIFHIGACSDTLEQRVNYMMVLNYEFTKRLADWSKNNNCKLIYSSSAANYGTNNKYPSNLYGWSKYAAEDYVRLSGGIGLRYFNVYGPGEEDKGRMASIAYQMFIKNIKKENIQLFPGKPHRDFVYVQDIVLANIYAAQNYKDLSGSWYEVGSGNSRTFEDILDLMDIKYTYTDKSLIPVGYQFFTQSNKLKWMHGWKPNYTLETGIKDYINYLDKTYGKSY